MSIDQSTVSTISSSPYLFSSYFYFSYYRLLFLLRRFCLSSPLFSLLGLLSSQVRRDNSSNSRRHSRVSEFCKGLLGNFGSFNIGGPSPSAFGLWQGFLNGSFEILVQECVLESPLVANKSSLSASFSRNGKSVFCSLLKSKMKVVSWHRPRV